MEKSKKTKLFFFAIIVVGLGALGYWVYANYLLSSLGIYTDNSANKAALKNRVYWCTLSEPKPCDPSWNPVKSNNPENEIRARVAAIGYKAQVLNGTPYGKLDFSPLGQRKAEGYAWKLYGDDWKGTSNHGNRSEVATAHKPDGPFPFQRNCKAMQNYFNSLKWRGATVHFEGFEEYNPTQLQNYLATYTTTEYFPDTIQCYGGYWTETTPVRKTVCMGSIVYIANKQKPKYWAGEPGFPSSGNRATTKYCSFVPPLDS